MSKDLDLQKLETLNEKELKDMNPNVAEAIRSIIAERAGTEEIEWQDFSSHSKD